MQGLAYKIHGVTMSFNVLNLHENQEMYLVHAPDDARFSEL